MTIVKEDPIKIAYTWEYEKLSARKRETIQRWIKQNVEPHRIKTYRGVTSHAIKHLFEESKDGFYITNRQLKVALDEAGFKPEDTWPEAWEYTISIRIFDY